MIGRNSTLKLQQDSCLLAKGQAGTESYSHALPLNALGITKVSNCWDSMGDTQYLTLWDPLPTIGLGLLQALPYLVMLVSVASYLRYVVPTSKWRMAIGESTRGLQ